MNTITQQSQAESFFNQFSLEIKKNVYKLPQDGSPSGGTKRPLNSYAVVKDDSVLLFDAAYSWALDGISRLGKKPEAFYFSHRDTVVNSDLEMKDLEHFGAPLYLHPQDAAHRETQFSDFQLEDPTIRRIHEAFGFEMILLPGHTDGSIMLFREEDGLLLAGDCLITPGPEQDVRPYKVDRPRMDQSQACQFREFWKIFCRDYRVNYILPLHGAVYVREILGAQFDVALANAWTGEKNGLVSYVE